MTVIRAAQAPQFELPGVRFEGLAAPSRGGAQVCTWRITVAPRFDADQAHTLDRDEIFMLTAGALRVTAVHAGDTLRVTCKGRGCPYKWKTITGKTFFPHLIANPFMHGLRIALTASLVMCLIAAWASWMRGGKYVHAEEDVDRPLVDTVPEPEEWIPA